MPNYRSQDEPVAGYKLIELLGEGAFGAVWKAEASGGVPVAMKIISKLNGIHAIREWQSLQAVKHLTHPNLVNIHGVWLRDEDGHVLSTDEVKAMIPAEAEQPAPLSGTPSSEAKAGPADPAARRRSSGQRQPKVDPRSTLRADTLQVGDTPSSTAPLDSPRFETIASPSGTDSGDAVPKTGSDGSAAAASAGSAASRERWAKMGDKVPPLELITAMTLGDGTMLDHLRRCQAEDLKGIPRVELMEYLHDAAKGLQYLNDADVYHCDIKPENLLVVGGSVQVCDYGSALRSIYVAEGLTNQGYTEPYAAPEQLIGKRIKVYKTTDLYALAITYYALRTGKFPWSDETDEPIAVIKHHERFDFSALGRMTRHRYEGDVLRKALKKDPKQRQKSVAEFLVELDRAIDQEALADAAARRRRRQIASWAAVAVVLMALVGAGFANRERLGRLVRPQTAHGQLSTLLSEDKWPEAIKFATASKELIKNEKTRGDAWTEFHKQLNHYGATYGPDRQPEVLARALEVPQEFWTPDAEQYILDLVRRPLAADLDSEKKLFAAAAEKLRRVPDSMPAKMRATLEQEIFDKWVSQATISQSPADAAATLVEISTALPDFKAQVGSELAKKLQEGVEFAEKQLNGPSAISLAEVASLCQRLATAADEYADGAATDVPADLSRLRLEAQVLGLAATVQQPPVSTDVSRQIADLKAAASAANNDIAAARLDLIAEAAREGNRLTPDAMDGLADAAKALEITPARLAEKGAWEVALYERLRQATYAEAAAVKGGLTNELQKLLRELPAEGSADLEFAHSLLVNASQADADTTALPRARDWIDGSKIQRSPADAQAWSALESWLDLANAGWFQPDKLSATLAVFGQWSGQPTQASLAERSLVAVLSTLVKRAEQAALASGQGASGQGEFPGEVVPAIETVDRHLPAAGGSASGSLSTLLAEASERLHLLRLRTTAVELSSAGLLTIPADLTAIKAARAIRGDATVANWPNESQPLGDLELAALRVEAHLLTQSVAAERPADVQDAWERISASAGAGDSATSSDGDYVSYVRDLASLRGWSKPADDALVRQATSKSPWLVGNLRRSTAAAELMGSVGQVALPKALNYVEQSARDFQSAGKRLDAVLAWQPSHPAAQALLPICRMYGNASPDWQQVLVQSRPITSDPQRVTGLQPELRLHLWLAQARASGQSAGGEKSRGEALLAYAAIVRDPQIFDPFGKAGLITPLDCYQGIVQPALDLLAAMSPFQLAADDPVRAAAAGLYGAQGVLLEGDFSRDLATEKFDYPGKPLAFAEATRDAFATAAQLEHSRENKLRWLAGQARAVELLLNRLGEEVPADVFKPFQELAKAVESTWPGTFEAHVLQGIAQHYQSRVAASEAARGELLAKAYAELVLAQGALGKHEQAQSPWCQGWLSQCRESLSQIALEQEHMLPWGLEKQELLKLAVEHAEAAEKIDQQRGILRANCLLCAGNAYEDLAVHLWCTENFELAESKFRAAVELKADPPVRRQLDPLVRRQAEAYLGRLLVRRAQLDRDIARNPAKVKEYADLAIPMLERVSRSLRAGDYQDLGLAHEADFYLADAYRNLTPATATDEVRAQDKAKARTRYQKIALEARRGSYDRINRLVQAARCLIESKPVDEAALKADIKNLEVELTDNAHAEFRVDLAELQFALEPKFEARKRLAEVQLTVLRLSAGDESRLAQRDILLKLARTQGTQKQLFDNLTHCKEVIAKIDNRQKRLESELLSAKVELPMLTRTATEAEKRQQAEAAVKAADEAIQCAERALAVAAQLDELQETVHCAPPVSKQRFDTAKVTLAIRKAAVQPVIVLSNYDGDPAYRDRLISARKKVQQWWQDANLEKMTGDNAPTDEQKREYFEHVRR